jgi:hypothetical protein
MNPFVQNFKLNLLKVNSSHFRVDTKNISDGIIGEYEKVEKSYLQEQQEKTSSYSVPNINNILFKELKSNGRDLFMYITYNLKKDSDSIELRPDKICEGMRITRGTMYTAVQQLIDVGLICKKKVSEYWINPYYLFKGNRINYYKQFGDQYINIVAHIKKS